MSEHPVTVLEPSLSEELNGGKESLSSHKEMAETTPALIAVLGGG